ncbi:HD domain-containing protein [Breznakiella homolactica]|uniref:HD domain-containing protein n=1 Tax=Breznakiella homolactica TaxID=2798577 RepID=A0A7T7XQ27_9SPIR|nr:HD domain-containing protein [Breznakiella homolactica]QQO10297.1 HD domain-containing protein [Breznakiella homolactica]
MSLDTIGEALDSAGYYLHLYSFTALDSYLGYPGLPSGYLETDADPAALARLFEGLRFPGPDLADAALDEASPGKPPDCTWYFRCIDRDSPGSRQDSPFTVLQIRRNWKNRHFLDPRGIYPALKSLWQCLGNSGRDGGSGQCTDILLSGGPGEIFYTAAMEAAVLVSRYSRAGEEAALPKAVSALASSVAGLPRGTPPNTEALRVLLSAGLLSDRSGMGLQFLMECGFVETLWPELAAMDNVDHSKEFHPEGNVWQHTLETLRYRKTADLRLSLGLLLHDSGKPLSESSGSRRFDGHAELGASVARKFLNRLEYEPQLIEDVCFLVRNHMLPAALPRLPLTRTQNILESDLFPVLMELYRCDESSSFKGLEGYYESSAAYQTYLRNRKNPYRSADGKKNGKYYYP